MAATEQFSLCWDNFHKNMSSGMHSMLESEDLVDVTLAVEGRYLKAHKMVLSVCSPYFRELFHINPCKHPIVFMKDVSYTAISDLLQFMYQGEVQVNQENLASFIKTAEALQIKGLTGDTNNQESSSESTEDDKAEEPPKQSPKQKKVTENKTVVTSTPVRTKKPPGPPLKRPKVSETVEDLVCLKMEPRESAEQFISENVKDAEESYTDNNFILDDTQDDNEDYTMEEEPKAGTSTDTVGDSQDTKGKKQKRQRKKLTERMRIVVNGFVYHNSVVRTHPPMRYLICSKYTKAGCRGRATLPLNGTLDQLKVTREHNHPPDDAAEEKHMFFKELKKAVRSTSNCTLKGIYDTLYDIYPKGAQMAPFESIRTSMRRWRSEGYNASAADSH